MGVVGSGALLTIPSHAVPRPVENAHTAGATGAPHRGHKTEVTEAESICVLSATRNPNPNSNMSTATGATHLAPL